MPRKVWGKITNPFLNLNGWWFKLPHHWIHNLIKNIATLRNQFYSESIIRQRYPVVVSPTEKDGKLIHFIPCITALDARFALNTMIPDSVIKNKWLDNWPNEIHPVWQ